MAKIHSNIGNLHIAFVYYTNLLSMSNSETELGEVFVADTEQNLYKLMMEKWNLVEGVTKDIQAYINANYGSVRYVVLDAAQTEVFK